MSCEAFERLIALDAGGDLKPAEAVRLKAHLEACAPCRELARSLGESQAGLKALAEADLDEDALVRWRHGLLARVEAEPRRPSLGWRWAWVAAAAMALAILIAIPRHTPPPPRASLARLTPPVVAPTPQQPIAAVDKHPGAQALPTASARLPRQPRPPALQEHRRPSHRRAPASAAHPLLVKLETSDPNVVIYWIVEGKGN